VEEDPIVDGIPHPATQDAPSSWVADSAGVAAVSITAETTLLGCTSNPTLVRSMNTGASYDYG
jgi:hypothetical protein